jgi:creatinine amidohydrolase/Fe(II)-dependent formamide hydrolase-like protein
MVKQHYLLSPLNLSRLTYHEVEKEIELLPALIFPLGGCEQYGQLGALGVAHACAEALANALAEKTRLLCAPVVNYGCSMPFQSFGGTAGIKSRTLINLLCETIRMWLFQGFKLIVIVDALMENHETIALVEKRLKSSHPDGKIIRFSLQCDPRVRAFIAKNIPGMEMGRTEYGMLSMAAWIDSALVRQPAGIDAPTIRPDAENFKRWHKRGADPEQFRKFFPEGSSSAFANNYNADFGKQLFGYILSLLEEDVALPVQSLQK